MAVDSLRGVHTASILKVAVSRMGISAWGKLLLTFASTVILGFGPRGTQDHIFLSPDSGCVCFHVLIYIGFCFGL
jgi:hypothetical protein